MSKDKYDERSTRLIGWWIGVMQRHAPLAIVVIMAATVGVLFYSVRNFKINTDFNSMISEKLHFKKIEKDFDKAFPQFSDTIVVMLDGDTPEQAMSARKRLAGQLRKEKDFFRNVYEPGGGQFFERNGLLYLSDSELEQVSDKLAEAQPLLALLSKDLSVRGLFSVLEMAFTRKELTIAQGGTVDKLLERMSSAFDNASSGQVHQVSWEEMMLGEKETKAQRRQFIITQPVINATDFSPGESALEAVGHIAGQLGIDKAHGVTMRLTGDTALARENMLEVRKSTGAATVISLILVAFTLYAGLGGSLRLVGASILTLITGLIWTTGFALLAIGSLNLISITFAVLFIGLGIDYCIQFCLRYRELVDSGQGDRESIITAGSGVGKSLVLSCITIAIGFYSFVPTAYAGVAELGLISGTGMFISLFATLTLLPALLTVTPVRRKERLPLALGEKLSSVPYRYPAPIIGSAFVLGVLSILVVPKVFFNYNPIDLYQESSECVSAIRDLCNDVNTQPWTASVLVGSEKEATALAEKLRGLKEVQMVITISDFVAEHQTDKLNIISSVALFMPPDLAGAKIRYLKYDQNMAALGSFAKALSKSPLMSGASGRRLYNSIQHFKQALADPVRGRKAFTVLETNMISGLPALFDMLSEAMKASAFNKSGLPGQLVNQYVSADGHYRVQVFPRENIMNPDALKRFVKAVYSITPDATDAPITIYESGNAVITSFKQATLWAIIAITIFLIFELRDIFVTGLVLTPLLLAMLMTAAASVLLHIPLNFANVIVVPVLLGIGVHSGIIFILRYKTEPPLHGNMLKTSTARAILFSSLTLLISTVSLSFSPHRGISSMGILLSICLCFVIGGTLVLLPALLHLLKKRITTRM